jgi:hypothetical protein
MAIQITMNSIAIAHITIRFFFQCFPIIAPMIPDIMDAMAPIQMNSFDINPMVLSLATINMVVREPRVIPALITCRSTPFFSKMIIHC